MRARLEVQGARAVQVGKPPLLFTPGVSGLNRFEPDAVSGSNPSAEPQTDPFIASGLINPPLTSARAGSPKAKVWGFESLAQRRVP